MQNRRVRNGWLGERRLPRKSTKATSDAESGSVGVAALLRWRLATSSTRDRALRLGAVTMPECYRVPELRLGLGVKQGVHTETCEQTSMPEPVCADALVPVMLEGTKKSTKHTIENGGGLVSVGGGSQLDLIRSFLLTYGYSLRFAERARPWTCQEGWRSRRRYRNWDPTSQLQ